jgi:hypothetical protein
MTAEERFAIVVKILKAALHVSSLRTTSDARKLPKLSLSGPSGRRSRQGWFPCEIDVETEKQSAKGKQLT